MKNNENFAMIFDMDGVIVLSNPHHKKTWKLFGEKYNKNLSDKDMDKHIYGRTNEDILQYLFGKKLSKEEIETYETEKELMYQQSHAPTLKPTKGLIEFLDSLKANNIKTAIATSAPAMNANFVVKTLNLKNLFNVIMDMSYVTKGKPDPEIYLKAADALGCSTDSCLIFEDSFSGIMAAKNAGIKVIGVTTTHSKEEFRELVEYTINDFTEINLDKIKELLIIKNFFYQFYPCGFFHLNIL